ncbi:MAG: ABC transporter ATP-binding protein [Gracilimonas sp.]|nr:ABC transporter ATP-binding protein [Gracilimonas sp.]
MISIKDLSFSYKRSKPLIKELDLELPSGNIYGLFGLNGAGKTTLLNIITGMIFPKSGACYLHAQDTKKRAVQTLREMYIVPEQFDLPKITGNKYVETHRPFYPRFDEDLMLTILKEFEVDLLQNLLQLSFGQRKKFLIAFAIATNTKLLIFDEPTNGLDIPSKSQFRRIIASLNLEEKCVLISTHQVRDLGSMIDHLIVLKNGSIVFDHSVQEIEKRLSFQKINSDSSTPYLYGEETLGEIHAILPPSDNRSLELDLELLFNGIISKTDEISEHFNGVKS